MILAVTGHRPDKLGGYGERSALLLQRLAREVILDALPDQVITGMALGWDIAVAKACVEVGAPFIAAIPFKGQESRWPDPSKRVYEALLAKAAEVVTVSPGGYAGWKMQVRNMWMVDCGNEIAALWDGSDGGTKNCVMYARQIDKVVTNHWRRWLEMQRDGACR